jgi:hypothetical protein
MPADRTTDPSSNCQVAEMFHHANIQATGGSRSALVSMTLFPTTIACRQW